MAAVETDIEVLTDGVVPNLVIQVKVRDESHPHVEGRFDCVEDLARFTVMAISVHARAGRELDGVITPSGVRELPLVQWEKIAKVAAQKWLRGPDLVSGSRSIGQRERAETVVLYMHPNLSPESGKGAARKFETLVRYAEVLDEYARWLSEGVEDPMAVIAEQRGVAPATVRSWLHRGREAGLDAAQRDMALGSRDPRWVGQLQMFQKLASPYDAKHSEILRTIHFAKARYLAARGSLMERRRERDKCQADPESYVWNEFAGQIRHYKNEALRWEGMVRESAEMLKVERARLRQREITPPLISRWLWPLVGEDLPAKFWPGGQYVPYSFNWDLGDD